MIAEEQGRSGAQSLRVSGLGVKVSGLPPTRIIVLGFGDSGLGVSSPGFRFGDQSLGLLRLLGIPTTLLQSSFPILSALLT